ncbi:alpha amylase, catalytic region, partial [mine drainage metagenome]
LPALDEFLARARAVGLEVALDLAWQCSPDHPWVREHPDWFVHRADGSIRYAENPPKRYRDIYPLDFVGPKASGLWNALADVVRFWARRGVRIFRVDNPHTKPFAFWEWLLRQIHTEFPGTIFLAEAFTRPGTMYHLAKIGFDESYTYFTWRTTPEELTEYFTELTGPPIRDFFRPMLFTNTPDILSPILVRLGRPAFMARAFLAATLSPLWGLYSGFEDLEGEAVPGTEEYADSEKYRVVPRGGPAPPENIRNFIQRL